MAEGNLNALFIGIFVFLGIFASLLALMPSAFLSMGITASANDKEAINFFSSQNVTMYNNTQTINLTYGTSEQRDWGLPAPELIEFWWDWGLMEFGRYGVSFQVRHLRKIILGYWYGWHRLKVQEPYRSRMEVPSFPQLMRKNDVITNFWNVEANASYVELEGNVINMKLFIRSANSSWTLEESWDNNELVLYSTYNIDFSRTGTSAWTVLMGLLTFQNPVLGVPGIFGTILSLGVGLTLWSSIAILTYALITALIPFVSGWRG